MAAANTDKFKKLTNNFSTTLQSAIVGSGDSSMSLSSTTNLPTDTGIVLVIDRVNASGTVTPTLREYVIGVVSGSTVISLVRGQGNSSAQAHLSGAVVEQVVDQTTINDIISGILVQHNQDGTHGAVTATSLSTSGTATSGGLLTASNGLTVTTGTVTLPTNAVSQAALPLGAVVQIVSTDFPTLATGTTIIPLDNTIPQNTEGDQYMTQAITPKTVTNILSIEMTMTLGSSIAEYVIAALFQDSTANALAATVQFESTAGANLNLKITHSMVAGTTSATTFKVRAGLASSGTISFNGRGGVQLFGGITLSNMKITEYKA